MSLLTAPARRSVRVTRVDAQSPTFYRLMEMGLIEGAEVCVVGRAPLGGPLHVRLGDYDLSLRAEDAAAIDVDA